MMLLSFLHCAGTHEMCKCELFLDYDFNNKMKKPIITHLIRLKKITNLITDTRSNSHNLNLHNYKFDYIFINARATQTTA